MRINAAAKKVGDKKSAVIHDTRMYRPSFELSHHADSEKYHHEKCSITNALLEVKKANCKSMFFTSNGAR